MKLQSNTLKNIATVVLVTIMMLIIGALFSSYTTKVSYKEWNKNEKLKVSDFTIVNDYIKTENSIPYVIATSYTSAGVTWDRFSNRYIITALFDKQRSFWYPEKIEDSSWTLNHEQGHFDITQAMAIALNRRFEDYILEPSEMMAQYQIFKKHEKFLQELYDKETNHSQDSLSQIRWNGIIAKLLK